MAGAVHMIERISLAGMVLKRARLGFNSDAALALQIHAIQELIAHEAIGDRMGAL